MEYELKTEMIEVPIGTGVEGFLLTMRTILSTPKVQDVSIDIRGRVTVRRYVEKQQFKEIGPTINFESVMPYACVRNGVVEEVPALESRPSFSIARMFQAVSRERMFPVAWIMGANPTLWDWFKSHEGLTFDNREEFYGLQTYRDRNVEDYVLLLAASYSRTTTLSDIQRTYKIIMPQRKEDALDRASSGEFGNPGFGEAPGVPPVGVRGGGSNGAGSPKA